MGGSDEDDDDENEDESGSLFNAIGSSSWPPFPTRIAVEEACPSGVDDAINPPVEVFPSPTAILIGSSASSPNLSKSRGKLPKVTGIKERITQRVLRQTALPSSTASAQRSGARDDSKEPKTCQRTDDGDGTLIIDNCKTSRSQLGRKRDPQSSGDGFTPQTIEMDLLELSFKYDHLEPLNAPAVGAAVSASTSTASVHEPENSLRATQLGPMPESPTYPNLDLATSLSKKRAATLPPPLPGRSAQRPAFMAIENPDSPTSVRPTSSAAVVLKSTAAGRADTSSRSSNKMFLSIRTIAELERRGIHPGCQAGQPCHNHDGQIPVPRDSHALVYHNTLTKDRRISLEEAEFVLSRANCFWARRFTVIWANWCKDKGCIEKEPRSQVEWLLSFPDLLRKAAKECCPKDVIMIDD